MPASIDRLIRKAEGTLKALRSMTAKEREQSPTHVFANDFNKFRRLRSKPSRRSAKLLPRKLSSSIRAPILYREQEARYVEIQAYYEQITGLLQSDRSSCVF